MLIARAIDKDAYDNRTLGWYQSLEISLIERLLWYLKYFKAMEFNSFFTKWMKSVEAPHLILWIKFYLLQAQRLTVKHHVQNVATYFDPSFFSLLLYYWTRSSSRSYNGNTSDYKISPHKCNRLFNELFFHKIKKSEDPNSGLSINELYL